MTIMRTLVPAVATILLGLAPALADDTKAGTGSPGTDATMPLGFDPAMAGHSADEQRAFFAAQTPDRQAAIRQRCETLTTTGSVANTDQPQAGTDATAGRTAPKGTVGTAASGGAAVMTFCDAIN